MMRYLSKALNELSENKFVFISGPRQTGKTTLSKAWLEDKGGNGAYLNWDVGRDRNAIRHVFKAGMSPAEFLVLDEIHKYSRWKQSIKGLYDELFPQVKTVVTGSSRLDIYQRGGDSLLGRYDLLRLHPFSVGEILRNFKEPPSGPPVSSKEWINLGKNGRETASFNVWQRLMKRSGFPEPYSKDKPLSHQRWMLRRRDLVLREDIRDISSIRSLDLVEELAELLPGRVGAPLSINSLKEDLQVSFDTIKSWIEMLERLYYCFRIPPFTGRIHRSLRKEQKLYLWDWSGIEDPGSRFENMVASHLLKSVHYWRDLGYGDYDLQYWRDREKREVDFIITLKRQVVAAIECKLSDSSISPSLNTFSKYFPEIPRIQLVSKHGAWEHSKNTLVAPAWSWLACLV